MDEEVVYCARHPQVETPLRCGRCETPICPRCLVQTPVGARCRDCAGVTRLPTYNVGPAILLKGLGAGLVAGAATGAAWGYLLPGGRFSIGFFSLIIGVAIGYAISEAIAAVTNRRIAPPLGLIGILAAIVAYSARNAVIGLPLLPQNDIGGYIVVAVAAFFAWTRLAR